MLAGSEPLTKEYALSLLKIGQTVAWLSSSELVFGKVMEIQPAYGIRVNWSDCGPSWHEWYKVEEYMRRGSSTGRAGDL